MLLRVKYLQIGLTYHTEVNTAKIDIDRDGLSLKALIQTRVSVYKNDSEM